MATQRQQIVLEMVSDSKGAVVGVKKLDESVSKLDKSTKDTTKSTASLGASMAKAKGAFLAAAAAIAVVGAALGKAVKAASDFEEANAKFGTVFRGVSKEANAMRKELVNAYGLSSTEATKYLAAVQDLFVPLGLARDEAAALSGETVKLARDISSFNNLPTGDVLRDIQSAMVGNFETVRKYGVVLNETTLKQAALDDNIKLVNGQISAQDKALIVLKKITEGSSDALGDYNRTQDSLANTAKKSRAILSDLTTVLGQEFLAAIKPAIEQLSKFTKMEGGIGKLRKAFKVLAVIVQASFQFGIKPFFVGFGLLLTPIIEGVKSLVAVFEILRNESLSTTEKLAELQGVVVDTFQATIDSMKDTTVGYLEGSKAVAENFAALFTTVEQNVIEGMDRIVEAGSAATGAMSDAAKAAEENAKATSEALGKTLTASMKTFGQASKDVFVSWAKGGEDMKGVIDGFKDKIADLVLSSAFQALVSLLLNFIAPGGGAAIGSLFGLFKEGGYTGDGGKNQAAGVVHKGEYVMKADRVNSQSKKLFDSINFGNYMPSRVGPGYASGGMVGGQGAMASNEVNIRVNVTGLDHAKWDELARDRIVPAVDRALNEMNRSIL